MFFLFFFNVKANWICRAVKKKHIQEDLCSYLVIYLLQCPILENTTEKSENTQTSTTITSNRLLTTVGQVLYAKLSLKTDL